MPPRRGFSLGRIGLLQIGRSYGAAASFIRSASRPESFREWGRACYAFSAHTLRVCFENRPVRGPGLQGCRNRIVSCRPRALTRRFGGFLKHALKELQSALRHARDNAARRPSSLFKNATSRSRGNEAQISSETEARSEPPYVGYFVNRLLASLASVKSPTGFVVCCGRRPSIELASTRSMCMALLKKGPLGESPRVRTVGSRSWNS
jgi:hypothetical protein